MHPAQIWKQLPIAEANEQNAAIQEEIALKPGHCLDPFDPIWHANPVGDIAEHLYWEAKSIDDFGNEFDWRDALDDISWQINLGSAEWYLSALKCWRVKLYKAWKGKFKSFKDWCENAIGCTTASINSKIRAARTISHLIACGHERLPKSPSVALELSKLDWESIDDIWRDICNKYADHEITLEKLKQELDDPRGAQPKLKQIRIPVDQWDRLSELAYQGGSSPQCLLGQILEGYLGTGQQAEPIETSAPEEEISEDDLDKTPQDPPIQTKLCKPKPKPVLIASTLSDFIETTLAFTQATAKNLSFMGSSP